MSTFDDFMINQKVKDTEELNRVRAELDALRQQTEALRKERDALGRDGSFLRQQAANECVAKHQAWDAADALRLRCSELETALREVAKDTRLKRRPCDDPQCGDSTWDHECTASSEYVPTPIALVARTALASPAPQQHGPDAPSPMSDAIALLKDNREALAAAFRVIATSENAVTALGAELARLGIADGIGVRTQEFIVAHDL